MSKAIELLMLIEEVDDLRMNEPVYKWVKWTFRNMRIPLDSVSKNKDKFNKDRLKILTGKISRKKLKKDMIDYAGEEGGDNYKKAFELLAREELRATKPKNIVVDWNSLSSHVEHINDDQVQAVVSFNIAGV